MRFLGAGGKMGFGRGYPYATGGDYVYLYEDTETGKTYRVHEFLSTGTSTLNVEVGGQMEYLIVAGGGGGGRGIGAGGGGAGGVLNGTKNVSQGEYSVIVGAGGTGAIWSPNTAAKNGENSSFDDLTAIGGGAGGSDRLNTSGVTDNAGSTGGSGGGGRYLAIGGAGILGQGFAGGTGRDGGFNSSRDGGGGGGASEIGETPATNKGGDGGDGIEWPIGSGRYFGGGGGGSVTNTTATQGVGGLGGGGNAPVYTDGTDNAESGDPNTGGGGGGSFNSYLSLAGAGGSGIVIVRYVVGEESYDIEEGQSLGTPTATQSSAGTWSLGEISNQDLVLAFDAIFPSTPAQGCLAEKGGTTLGFWCGLKSSGTYFRVRAGGGGSAPASNITLLDIYDFPADDQLHTVVVEINVGTGMTMRVWIDGVYKGSATSTATSAAGTGSGVFLSGGANVNITGEPTAAWPGGTAKGEARFYSNTLIS